MNKILRIPDELAKRIEALAKQNKRSFNAEVLIALEQYAGQQNRPDEQFWTGIDQRSRGKRNE